MFDYMIKILPNGIVLVRKNSDKTSVNLKPKEVSKYLETELSNLLEEENTNEMKLKSIREEALRKL